MKKKLSDEQIKRAIANASASVEMEGLGLIPDDVTEAIRKYLKGEIPEEEVLSYIRNR